MKVYLLYFSFSIRKNIRIKNWRISQFEMLLIYIRYYFFLFFSKVETFKKCSKSEHVAIKNWYERLTFNWKRILAFGKHNDDFLIMYEYTWDKWLLPASIIRISRKAKEFALESLISPAGYTRLTTWLLRLIVRFAPRQYVKFILDYFDVYNKL